MIEKDFNDLSTETRNALVLKYYSNVFENVYKSNEERKIKKKRTNKNIIRTKQI